MLAVTFINSHEDDRNVYFRPKETYTEGRENSMHLIFSRRLRSKGEKCKWFMRNTHRGLSPRRMLRKHKYEQWRERQELWGQMDQWNRLTCLPRFLSSVLKKKKTRQLLGQWETSYQWKKWCVTNPGFFNYLKNMGLQAKLSGTTILCCLI